MLAKMTDTVMRLLSLSVGLSVIYPLSTICLSIICVSIIPTYLSVYHLPVCLSISYRSSISYFMFTCIVLSHIYL